MKDIERIVDTLLKGDRMQQTGDQSLTIEEKIDKILERQTRIECYIDNIQDTMWLMQDKYEYIDNSVTAINEKLGLKDKELGHTGFDKVVESVKEWDARDEYKEGEDDKHKRTDTFAVNGSSKG